MGKKKSQSVGFFSAPGPLGQWPSFSVVVVFIAYNAPHSYYDPENDCAKKKIPMT